jgi:2-dehydro-3-deoxyglucarate aldolase
MKQIDMLKNIRKKLDSGIPTLGSWLQIPSPVSAEIIASSPSFDWITIDLEHSSISIETCEIMIRSIEQAGSVPFVRLSSNDETLVKRVMDSGALGVIFPNVATKKDIVDAYSAMHFPPEGKRGVGLARAQSWGRSFERYKDEIDPNTLLIAQIENKEAAKNIDEIFSTGFVDAYIIGPYDLSASFGKPGDFEQDEFKKALEKIKESAVKHSIPSGYHLVEPDHSELKGLIKAGHSFIAYSTDAIILSRSSILNDYK